ncbi:hypothetical protein fugu_003264 [Takifugu bimaculatus]|uniref:FAM86 N-terminal domain-containing protein n=1 Tax=Takifugu bimaculatus TaxID=433685 RepID=A0A4Z2BFE5_9TELE|nr:hypothetical protein fugu_003264 [Takifugu bimaculatus]
MTTQTCPKAVGDSSSKEEAGATEDTELAKAVMAHQFHPSVLGPESWEGYRFSDMEIRIKESTDLYGAVLWPSVLTDLHNITTALLSLLQTLNLNLQQAMVLCHFLETNQDKFSLRDKNVIELGAGTGLVTISIQPLRYGFQQSNHFLKGAKVTSTDLPDVLGNLQYNVTRNTKGRCKYIPLVTELTWGQEVEQRFPRDTHCFDYILAADVVYSHPYLEELMATFDHLCQETTEILWAMRFRLDPENSFVDRFRQRFHLGAAVRPPQSEHQTVQSLEEGQRDQEPWRGGRLSSLSSSCHVNI